MQGLYVFKMDPSHMMGNDLLLNKLSPVEEILIVCRSEEDAHKLEHSGFTIKNKIKNEITLKVENKSSLLH